MKERSTQKMQSKTSGPPWAPSAEEDGAGTGPRGPGVRGCASASGAVVGPAHPGWGQNSSTDFS